MNDLPDQFDFLAWHDSIAEFMWWEDPDRRYSWHLLETTRRAHAAKSKYWLDDKMGREPLDLTDLYEKIKLLTILKEDHHGTKT
jgi:hypothetical protein